ncbi:carboxymuconolactone decarboxylase family protein [Candidatus Entotheonella palauensis]|nr:carboxymuconolactone decarboxylase family protein [Candidatus Entotheonella palauensis]
MDDATMDLARQDIDHASLTKVEQLCLQYADRMTDTPFDVDDTCFERLREHFSETQLVELTAVIAWENFRARFNHAFGLESDGYYQDDVTAPREDRVAQS